MKISAATLFSRLLARGKFRHVQVLLTLAELGSVLRTAEAIGMTQSSVTQALAYLERLLEVELFERHARGMRPTVICLELLPVARQLIQGIAQGAESVAARRNAGQTTLRLICSGSAVNSLLIDSLPAYAPAHPDVLVQIREAEGEDLLLAIARQEVDLAVCRRPLVMPAGWRFEHLRQDRLAILCAAGHPLAQHEPLAGELSRQRWLLLPAGSIARIAFDTFAARLPSMPPVVPLVSRSPVLIQRLLREYQALVLLPLSLMAHLVRAGEIDEVTQPTVTALDSIGILIPDGITSASAAGLTEFLLAFHRQ